MKITLAQINPTIGDIEGNFSKMEKVIKKAKKNSYDLIIFPELSFIGYPPLDLLEKKWFLDKVDTAIEKMKNLSKKFPGIGIIAGAPLRKIVGDNNELFNSAILIQNGEILSTHDKLLLPTYDVFDEDRYFKSSEEIKAVKFKNEILGISICEDMWYEQYPGYCCNPIEEMKNKGATILINISASPFSLGKDAVRYNLISNHALKHKIPFIFVNQVGSNDELIFDGTSMAVNSNGYLVKILPGFVEHISTIDTNSFDNEIKFVSSESMESLLNALKLGVKDYVKKCGFTKVVVGLSGGIDSAVTAVIAKEALGSENVLGVTMPSEYSSEGSVKDSKKLADNLGITFKLIPIREIFNTYSSVLKDHFKGKGHDVTEENIQARIRGNILMALSNKFGNLVLSTGNKSEISVGYCTLYGDMSGGLSVISDVPKTMVYNLAKFINKEKEIIPKEIIEKEPSAELRPNQKDQDTLPPYEILDKILELVVEKGYSQTDIEKEGFDKKIIEWIIIALKRTEYKRRQASPGLKVTTKAFGMGRKMPIASKY